MDAGKRRDHVDTVEIHKDIKAAGTEDLELNDNRMAK
jgi:hypothetical protein